MAIEEKIAAAKQINELLNNIVRLGGFRVKYRIAVDPPLNQGAEWDRPAILVDFSGPDSSLLVARGGELLHALEMITVESVGDMLDEHDRISFDSMGFRQARNDELVMAAKVAAEKVQKTGVPYAFGPMNSRERRVVHLALAGVEELRTESEGEGPARHLVVYPKSYKGKAPAAPATAGRPSGRSGGRQRR
jgi:spoIIIJ-associated protein